MPAKEPPAPPVPPSVIDRVPGALDQFLADFEAVPRPKVEEAALKGSQLPAHLDIYAVAFAHSNRTLVSLTTAAAQERGLPSPQFAALRVRFSDKSQALLCIPEPTYAKEDPELYPVIWSKDGKEFRVDLTEVLVPKQWRTPVDMFRRVPATLHRNLPGIHAALILDLKSSELHPESKKKGKGQSDSLPVVVPAKVKAEAAATEQRAPDDDK